MLLIKKAGQLFSHLNAEKKLGKRIGFVPTMGALHAGHLSLIVQSGQENDLTVCSIFVNPTQFNNADDFNFYPVTIEKDIEQLVSSGCDILFLPPVAEIYPPGHTKKNYPLGQIENMLEGYYRPGHFQGVAQVVERLLEIVQPDRLYLGQKDYQQCMVIKKLIQILDKESEIQLIPGETVREADGLAMSSRNLRLNETNRKAASAIFETLRFIKEQLPNQSLEGLKEESRARLEEKGFIVDYVELADADTLESATDTNRRLIALIAASINGIRLIDNQLLN